VKNGIVVIIAILTALSFMTPAVAVGGDTPALDSEPVRSDTTSAPSSASNETSQTTNSTPDAFQIDLVQGEVLQRLNPEAGDTYHKQDRFIIALQITENERQRGGPGTPMTRTYQSDGCEVSYSWLSFDNTTGVSQVAVSVSDAGGCEGITLSYAGYELPDGTTEYQQDRADEQELKDSVTRTLNAGDNTTFTVDVIDEEAATFEVASVDAPDVEQGQTANVTATIENTGNATGTQNVTLSVENTSIEQSSEESLAAGESRDVMFSVDTTGLSPGTYNVTVETANDTVTTTWNVTQPSRGTPMFEITSVNAPGVQQGETANVTATVENAGTENGTQNVTLSVENTSIEQSSEESLNVTEVIAVTFGVDTTNLSAGTYNVTVSTQNDTETTTLTVTGTDDGDEVANFQVVNVVAPDTMKGDTANVTATVENTGNATGTQNISLLVEGENITLRSEETLAAGASKEVMFEVGTSALDPGTYNVTVETANDTVTTTWNVTEPDPPSFQITSLNAPSVQQGETANITATVENTGDLPGTQNITYQLEGENITTGTGAVDIVFVLDQSGSMTDDNEVMRRNLVNFTNELEEQDIDARYAVISMERPATVTQGFTSDVNETQQSIDDIIMASGLTEDNFEALRLANQLHDQEGRPGATRIIIDVTDEGSNVQSPTQQELSDTFNRTNTTYLAVTPNATSGSMAGYPESTLKRPIVNMTQSGEWYDLIAGDFGEKFVGDIPRDIRNVSEDDEGSLTLNASETGQKSFRVNTTNLPPGTYDVTVSTENDTETTTFEVLP
jgi:Mg-chelatase subunit ChlD